MQLKIDRQLDKCFRFRRDRIEPYIERTVLACTVSAFEHSGEPEDPLDFVRRAEEGGVEFIPARFGERWGTTWGTTWFRIEGVLDRRSLDDANNGGDPLELVVDLGWLDHAVGGHIEGMVYCRDGTVVKAVHPRNGWVRLAGHGALPHVVDDDGSFRLYLEAACNPLLVHYPGRSTDLGDGPTTTHDLPYLLKRIDVCAFDRELWAYWMDLDVVSGLVGELPADSMRRLKLARSLQLSLNAYDDDNRQVTLPAARAVLRDVLGKPAVPTTLHENAIGHAHIDSAYLWPIRETRRKVARTVSNVLALMDDDPRFLYAMSSAQQYEWLEQDHPDLFARMKSRVAQGRFIPVGGMWVEADGMMPCGESLVRQISFGKRYMREHLGVDPQGIWLPDSFGYTGAYPQIARRAGYQWFLTQKISWGDATKFPHHSFMWEGIDGTQIFTHFPPTDTYAAEVTPRELTYAERNFKDKAIADQALLLYGYGDGGGGPTREMVGRIARMHDLEGVPTVEHATPDEFFAKARAQIVDQAHGLTVDEIPHWSGELYLELHRKTLTSQQEMKRGCRMMEGLLRTVEYLGVVASLKNPDYAYPRERLDRVWKTLLLNQFHDILPGSALSWVHREAREDYRRDERVVRELIDQAIAAIRQAEPECKTIGSALICQNDWRAHVACGTVSSVGEGLDGSATVMTTPSLTRCDEGFVLDNGLIRATVRDDGTVSSLVLVESGREVVPQGERLGRYLLLNDKPSRYDSWEIERDAFLSPSDASYDVVVTPIADISSAGGRAGDGVGSVGVEVRARIGRASSVVTRIGLAVGSAGLDFRASVDWNETDRLLKVDLPLAVQASQAVYECQYGTVSRPIAKNTEADEAKFESCTHRFVHVGEGGFGVGLVNASTYGASAFPVYADGASGRTRGVRIGMSLLSAATYPDPKGDCGRVHAFAWQVLPGVDVAATVRAANVLNAPVLDDVPSFDPPIGLAVTKGDALIDWIKLADDASGDVIVRVYEPCGGRAEALLRVDGALFGDALVRETVLTEDGPLPADVSHALSAEGLGRVDGPLPADGARLVLGPYQFATLRLSRR